MWDVFISYSSEDREHAMGIAGLLRDQNIHVWIDGWQLKLGDRIRKRIDEGLAKSKYGVVILSPSYFSKTWPQRELEALLANEEDRKVVLPVWHKVSRKQVAEFSLILADRVAANTNSGLEVCADQILEVVGGLSGDSGVVIEGLLQKYNELEDPKTESRVAKKREIRNEIAKNSKSFRNFDLLYRRRDEGSLLAIASLLADRPRRNELLRLVDVCRRSKHKYVWAVGIDAMEVALTRYDLTDRQKLQIRSELEALKFKRPAHNTKWIAARLVELQNLLEPQINS